MVNLEFETITHDHQLFRLKDFRFIQHLLADILTNHRAAGAVNIKVLVGKMKVLTPMKGGQISGLGKAASPITHAAGSAGMGVNEIDFFILNDPVQLKDVPKATPQTLLVNGNRIEFGLGGMAKLTRSDKNSVSILDLDFNERCSRGFGPCHKIAA